MEVEISATVMGVPYTEIPSDLFIPPDALEILLDTFSGPLDLLLYLIRRQNMDILDIPIARITEQYMQYIALMKERRLELAADYLVMAAMLAEIKSRMLLPPVPSNDEEVEEDPRQELVRKLLLYEKIKQAAEELDSLPRAERDVFRFSIPFESQDCMPIYPDVELLDLQHAMQDLLTRQSHLSHHQISRELMSVRERMALILQKIQSVESIPFTELCHQSEGRLGLVVSLLAILELARQSLVKINQAEAFSAIYLRAING